MPHTTKRLPIYCWKQKQLLSWIEEPSEAFSKAFLGYDQNNFIISYRNSFGIALPKTVLLGISRLLLVISTLTTSTPPSLVPPSRQDSANHPAEPLNPTEYMSHQRDAEHLPECQPLNPPTHPPVTFLPQHAYAQPPSNEPMYSNTGFSAPAAPRAPFPKEQSVWRRHATTRSAEHPIPAPPAPLPSGVASFSTVYRRILPTLSLARCHRFVARLFFPAKNCLLASLWHIN